MYLCEIRLESVYSRVYICRAFIKTYLHRVNIERVFVEYKTLVCFYKTFYTVNKIIVIYMKYLSHACIKNLLQILVKYRLGVLNLQAENFPARGVLITIRCYISRTVICAHSEIFVATIVGFTRVVDLCACSARKKRRAYIIFICFVHTRHLIRSVPRSRHARDGPIQMGFEEEAAFALSTGNVFPREGFLVIFCLYVAWDEEPRERGIVERRREDDSFLRCMFVVGSTG